MDLDLTDRRALVTGSSSGIGEAVAGRLAGEGAAVLVHGRNPEAVARVSRQIRAGGGHAEEVVVDLLAEDGPEVLAARSERLLGGVDIVVHSAACGLDQPWDKSGPSDWRMLYDLNVIAAARIAKVLTPGMTRRGWGRIIHIASGAATDPPAEAVAYSASKAAVVNLSVSLAKSLARTGVTVNTVSPGVVLTPRVEAHVRAIAEVEGWGDDWDEIERRVLERAVDNPTGRLGRADDVAAVVTFLASPLSGFVNGANYRVDGGSTTVVN